MANYFGCTRSNYFRVTDPDRLERLIEKTAVSGDDNKLTLSSRTAPDGTTFYGFVAYGSIDGIEPDALGEYDYDCDYDPFIAELQDILVDGDAVLIEEIGHEKLRYFTAVMTVITKYDVETIDLENESYRRAEELLGDKALELGPISY